MRADFGQVESDGSVIKTLVMFPLLGSKIGLYEGKEVVKLFFNEQGYVLSVLYIV